MLQKQQALDDDSDQSSLITMSLSAANVQSKSFPVTLPVMPQTFNAGTSSHQHWRLRIMAASAWTYFSGYTTNGLAALKTLAIVASAGQCQSFYGQACAAQNIIAVLLPKKPLVNFTADTCTVFYELQTTVPLILDTNQR